MKFITQFSRTIFITFILVGIFSCDDKGDNIIIPPVTLNTFEKLEISSNYSVFTAALKLTGLDQLLVTSDTFTILAPDNKAFTDINLATYDTDEKKENLKQILLNHIISGIVNSSHFNSEGGSGYKKTLARYNSTPNKFISIYYKSSGGIEFNGTSKIINKGADINTTNGIIHFVDTLIKLPSIADFIALDSDFADFNTEIESTNLIDTIKNLNHGTILVPNNNAINKWETKPKEDDLIKTLKYHMVYNKAIYIADLPNPSTITALDGGDFTISTPANDTKNPAKITDGIGNSDIDIIGVQIQAIDGLLYSTNKVLAPIL